MSETAPVGGQTMNDRVTEEIRVLLARRRLRDHALAPVLGVSQQSVSMRLRGRKPWTVDELDAVASFFAVQDANTLLPGLGKQGVDEVCAPWDLNPEPADHGLTCDDAALTTSPTRIIQPSRHLRLVLAS